MATSDVTSPTKTESPANIGSENKDSKAKFEEVSPANVGPENKDSVAKFNAPPAREGSVISNSSRSTSGGRSLEMDFAVRLRKNAGPTTDLPFVDTTVKPFNNRCRLYVGHLPSGTTENEVKEIFEAYGTLKEVFVNTEKSFGFLRTATRALAEQALHELDGSMYKGRPLRVRFLFANCAVKVRNLNSFVTNELLEWGFQVFGEIERAVVICDECGKSTGEGIVEFTKRSSAVLALKKCTEGAYFLSHSLRPVIVEAYPTDDLEGFPEKSLLKNSGDYYEERSVGPWFAEAGSFEAQCADQWKEHFLIFKEKFEALKFEQKVAQDKLVAKMDYAQYENETERLRQQLLEREILRETKKQECEMLVKQAEDQKRLFEENLKKQAEERIRLFRDGPAEPLNE